MMASSTTGCFTDRTSDPFISAISDPPTVDHEKSLATVPMHFIPWSVTEVQPASRQLRVRLPRGLTMKTLLLSRHKRLISHGALLLRNITIARHRNIIFRHLAIRNRTRQHTSNILATMALTSKVLLIMGSIMVMFRRIRSLLHRFKRTILLRRQRGNSLRKNRHHERARRSTQITTFRLLLNVNYERCLRRRTIRTSQHLSRMKCVTLTHFKVRMLSLTT